MDTEIEEIKRLLNKVIEYCNDKKCENIKMKLIRISNRFEELKEEIEDLQLQVTYEGDDL